MKKSVIISIISFIITITLSNGIVNAAGGLTDDDCNTGTYSSYYDTTCDKCGYFNGNIHRLYYNTPKDYWDYYINTTNRETIFSNLSQATVIDYGTYLNNEALTGLNVRSSWVPANIDDDEAIIFRIKDLLFNNTTGASRSTPIGMIEYNLRAVPTDPLGDTVTNAFDHYYTHGVETQNSNGTWNLDMSNEISSGVKTARIFTSAIYEHKECYAILPAWCGDGVIDSFYGETCDPNDPTQTAWGNQGCTNTCQPDNDTGGGGGGGSDYCGDGVVQRPNDNGVYEECDFGSSSDWSFCSRSSCQIGNVGGGSGDDGQLTIPNDGSIVFGPIDYVTIGDGMNPYEEYSLSEPYIYNNSIYQFHFDSLCVAKHSGASVAGTTNQCRDFPSDHILDPGERVNFSDLSPYTSYPNFVGYPDGISSGTVGENKLVTTIKQDGVVYSNAYFAGDLRVRVAKPTITTTGGGTSFVNNTNNISDVNNVATNNVDSNKNFVGAGVSSGDISSYAKDVTEEEKVAKVVEEGQEYNENANKDTDYSGYSMGTTDNLSEFESYNGIENAFILKDKNFEIDSNIFSLMTGARTYIIENGNLIINSDINYNENIAFVVKGGNIQIDSSVTNMDGIYITIPNGSIGGEFEGIGGKTFDILVVDGSLYGNVEKLVSQRTYIKENSSGLIDVGTVVSFGSSVFREPAPLTTTFINEFIEATKVAQ